MLYVVVRFFASSLVSFFNLLFSNYVLKILAFLPPPKLAKNVNNVQKVGFLS